MLTGLKAWWFSLLHINHRGYVYVWANVLWFLLSLPILTAPAAWAGLVKMSHQAHQNPTTDIHDFLAGFKEQFWNGLVMATLNIIIIGVNISNLTAYSHIQSIWMVALRISWIIVLLLWIAVQFYMWSLLYEMKQPTLIGAMRNAIVMILLNPFFTLGIWLGVLLLIFLSVLLPIAWFLLTGSTLAAIANGAVLNRLQVADHKNTNLSDNSLPL